MRPFRRLVPERSPPRRPEEMSRVELRDADFASPLRARSLLTVAAAICFARLVERPCFFSLDPTATARTYERLGFRYAPPGPSERPRVEVGGAFVELHEGEPGEPERPLLNHLAVLVDSTDEHISEAEELGVEIDDIVDAPNTYAVFLWGPERVRIEYVEHKASFSLT